MKKQNTIVEEKNKKKQDETKTSKINDSDNSFGSDDEEKNPHVQVDDVDKEITEERETKPKKKGIDPEKLAMFVAKGNAIAAASKKEED